MAAETVNHTERAHALLSASGASRWLNCTPSPRLEEDFPEETSDFAQEGTLAHEFAEINLKRDLKIIPAKQYNKLAKEFRSSKFYTSEMEEEVQKHIDYVKQQYIEAVRTTPDAKLLIEERVDLTEYIEEGYGTNDDIIIADGVLEVIDLKYGKGLRVSAEQNPQLKLYGLGALRAFDLMYDIHTIRLTITQPRLDAISSWEVSREELIEWGETIVRPTAVKAYAGEGEQKPGDWCRFCKAKPKCKALADLTLKTVKEDFTNPNIETILSDNEVLDIYQKSAVIIDWLNSLGGYILSEAVKGKKWEGLKLVESRSNRTITDPDKVEEVLIAKGYNKEEFTNSKLKGIGDLEKLLGKKNFNPILLDYIDKPKGKPTLTTQDDKRPEYFENEAFNDFSSLFEE
jgi:hypothetical protein